MICLELNRLFYDPSGMLQLSDFVWALRSSVWVVFNNFLLIDATDRSKISSDQKCVFFAVSLYPLSFFANTPFNVWIFDGTIKLRGHSKIKLSIFVWSLKEKWELNRSIQSWLSSAHNPCLEFRIQYIWIPTFSSWLIQSGRDCVEDSHSWRPSTFNP